MQSADKFNSRSVIWKSKVESSGSYNDEQIRRVVDIIKSGDESRFINWITYCDDIDMRDSSGNTALHWAAVLGDVRALTHLLLAGARPDVTNINNASPLHCAAYGGHVSVIEQLLRHGADAMAENLDGKNMFDVLRDMKWNTASILYSHLENVLRGSIVCGRNLIDMQFVEGAILGLTSATRFDDNDLPSNITYLATCDCKEGNKENSLNGGGCNRSSQDALVTGANSMFLLDELERLNQSSELVLLCAEEARERCNVIREYAQCMLNMVHMTEPGVRPSHSGCTKIREVEVVFGEKYSSSGARLLLVRMVGEAEGAEKWVAAEEVAHCGKVAEYINRPEQACTRQSLARGGLGRCQCFAGAPLNAINEHPSTRQALPKSDETSLVRQASDSFCSSPHRELAPLRNPPSSGKAQYIAASSNCVSNLLQKKNLFYKECNEEKSLFQNNAVKIDEDHSCGNGCRWNRGGFLPNAKEKKPLFDFGGVTKRFSAANNNSNCTSGIGKLPFLKRKLSSRGREEYEAILRQSALRYLIRKRDLAKS